MVGLSILNGETTERMEGPFFFKQNNISVKYLVGILDMPGYLWLKGEFCHCSMLEICQVWLFVPRMNNSTKLKIISQNGYSVRSL